MNTRECGLTFPLPTLRERLFLAQGILVLPYYLNSPSIQWKLHEGDYTHVFGEGQQKDPIVPWGTRWFHQRRVNTHHHITVSCIVSERKAGAGIYPKGALVRVAHLHIFLKLGSPHRGDG